MFYGSPYCHLPVIQQRRLVDLVLRDDFDELYKLKVSNKFPLQYDVNDKDIECNGMNLMHWAAYANSIDCFIFLYKKGWNMFEETSSGYTTLHYAIHSNSELVLAFIFKEISKNEFLQKEILKIYEKSYKIRTCSKVNLIYLTITDGSAYCLQKLFDFGFNFRQCETTKFIEEIFSKCILKRKADCLAVLLKNTSNTHDLLSKTPVMLATEHNNLEGLKLLLESGYKADDYILNSNNEYNNALSIATFLHSPNPQIVSLLLDHIRDLTLMERNAHDTAAHWACQSRNLKIATMILDRAYDVKSLDKHGKSAAHYLLSWKNQEESVRVMMQLISKGFDVNTVFPNHETILGECLKGLIQNFKMIDLLLREKANVNAKMYKQDKPFTTCKEFILQRNKNQKFKQIIDNFPDIFS